MKNNLSRFLQSALPVSLFSMLRSGWRKYYGFKCGYLNEVASCYRIHEDGIWTKQSLLEQLQHNQKAIDLLDNHFKSEYHLLLREREYYLAVSSAKNYADRGLYHDARAICRSSAPRLVHLFPLKILAWVLVVYGGYWCQNSWNRFTKFAAIRTRIQRISAHLKSNFKKSKKGQSYK
jgi:hypothetical protein